MTSDFHLGAALWVLITQGIFGAFDTIYFHEYRARLPQMYQATKELRLHAFRDFIYSIIFLTLPWLAWRGWWAGVLIVLIALEIVITMYDFVVEDTTRRTLGGIYPAERVTHGLMGIIYGIFLGQLFPILKEWDGEKTGLALMTTQTQIVPRCISTIMGFGVFLSGVRDFVAAYRSTAE